MPSQILLFSLPRSGCHMLERMLTSDQPNLVQCWHPFQSTVPLVFKWLQSDPHLNPEDPLCTEVLSEARAAVDRWRESLAEAQSLNRILYFHDHPLFCFSPARVAGALSSLSEGAKGQSEANETLMPEDLLLHDDTVPILTIRHPILSVPSNYRAMKALNHDVNRNVFLATSGAHWSRELHDWFKKRGIKPVVVDADDYMTSEDFVRFLCTTIGLDPQRAKLQWAASSEAEVAAMHAQLLVIQDTLVHSSGLVPGRAAKNNDLTKVVELWKEEFSSSEIELLQEAISMALPHYEYLSAQRLRMDASPE